MAHKFLLLCDGIWAHNFSRNLASSLGTPPWFFYAPEKSKENKMKKKKKYPCPDLKIQVNSHLNKRHKKGRYY